jgi:hypothetical protein
LRCRTPRRPNSPNSSPSSRKPARAEADASP